MPPDSQGYCEGTGKPGKNNVARINDECGFGFIGGGFVGGAQVPDESLLILNAHLTEECFGMARKNWKAFLVRLLPQ